jgi:hypothetical protein
MRHVIYGLWFFVLLAVGASADEAIPAEELPATEPQAVESPASAEEDADAEIRQIEAEVSGAGEVKEFIPTKPLSADKAISLPSDI